MDIPTRTAVHELLQSAQRLLRKLLDEHLKPMSLTPTQFVVLRLVADLDIASDAQLERLSGVDRATLAQTVEALVRRRLLFRRPSRSAHGTQEMHLSMSGATVLGLATTSMARVEKRLATSLPAGSYQRIIDDLCVILSDSDHERRPAPDHG